MLEHKEIFLASAGIGFIVGTGCSYIAYSLLAWINRRREQAIEKQFDDEE